MDETQKYVNGGENRTVYWKKGHLRVPQAVVIFIAKSISEIKVGNKKGHQILRIKFNTMNHLSCSEEPSCFTKVWSEIDLFRRIILETW